jgi:hypothetical protein
MFKTLSNRIQALSIYNDDLALKTLKELQAVIETAIKQKEATEC